MSVFSRATNIVSSIPIRMMSSAGGMTARSLAEDTKLAHSAILRSAGLSAARGAAIGGVYGGVNNPDGNHAGGAFSGAIKGGLLGGALVGGGLKGARIYSQARMGGPAVMRTASDRLVSRGMVGYMGAMGTARGAVNRGRGLFS